MGTKSTVKIELVPQSVNSQAKCIPVINKAYEIGGRDIVEIRSENKALNTHHME